MVEPVKLRPNASQAAKPARPSILETLIRLEGEAIASQDSISLRHQAVNKPRSLLDCGHIFWVSRKGSYIKLLAVTGQDTMDRQTPFAQWLTAELKSHAKAGQLESSFQWQLMSRRESDLINYPYTCLLYTSDAADE